MKKLALLLLTTLLFVSCSLEDDGPRIAYQYAKVTTTDLPESFEKGKTYTVKVTYRLPSACHTPAGVEARRGSQTGEARRDIFVAGVTSYDANVTNCNTEAEDEDLLKQGSFSITIDEEETYTFFLWNGVNSSNQAQYIEVEVPVVDPATGSGQE